LEEEVKHKEKKKDPSRLPVIIAVFFVFSVIGAVTLYIYFQKNFIFQDDIEGEIKAKYENLLNTNIKKLSVIDNELNERLEDIEKKQLFIDREIISIKNLDRSSSTSNRTEIWLVNEVKYLLKIANLHDQFTMDSFFIIGTLQQALDLMMDFNDQEAMKIKNAIESEIENQIAGSIKNKDQLIADINQFIDDAVFLRRKESQQPSIQNDDQSTSIYKEIWKSLSSSLNEMISVQKLDQYEQNIKISEEIITRHLQQLLFDAKQSLEINRWVLYEISIDQAIKWLEIYFDSKDKKVALIIEKLQEQSNYRAGLMKNLPEIIKMIEDYQLLIEERTKD
tara:strand:+ start:1696 stop:2703 length:1008 start_codon:yes stop_codon:yes gene_type:complete